MDLLNQKITISEIKTSLDVLKRIEGYWKFEETLIKLHNIQREKYILKSEQSLKHLKDINIRNWIPRRRENAKEKLSEEMNNGQNLTQYSKRQICRSSAKPKKDKHKEKYAQAQS